VADDRLLRLARELEARDERLAAAIAEVEALQRSGDEVRERARTVREFLERLPRERLGAEAAVREAESDATARRRALAEAEDELGRAEQSGDREHVAAAHRGVVRARDAAASAERKAARAADALSELDRRERSTRDEIPRLDERAHELAARIAGLPRVSRQADPAPGLDGTIDWGSRARAALFVVRSGLDTERERLVREANELAASALGEAAAATSVALVRERIEQGTS
jgi:DNA repair exonuclease SbcCD ATPase subunit